MKGASMQEGGIDDGQHERIDDGQHERDVQQDDGDEKGQGRDDAGQRNDEERNQGHGTYDGRMSEMMHDMGQMMESGKMRPEQMSDMSKMMGDIPP
jgi:hypothetical protein